MYFKKFIKTMIEKALPQEENSNLINITQKRLQRSLLQARLK